MMQREFTKKEKILLLILVVLVLGLLYYMAVYETTTASIQDAQNRAAYAQEALLVEQARAARMENMQKELDVLLANGSENVPRIADYDNIQSLMKELNRILAGTTDYSISFEAVSFEDGLARRPMNMTFTASGYAQAKTVLSQLASCKYRSLPGSLSMSSTGGNLGQGGVSVRMDIVFYELYEMSDQEAETLE